MNNLVEGSGRWVQSIINPYFGGDPEFFLSDKDGNVVGSERFIPKDGLMLNTQSGIIRDGVQAEIKFRPDTCRATVGNGIKAIFITLQTALNKEKQFGASFNPVIKVDKRELDQLSEDARVLGCAPSINVYNADATVNVKKGFRTRSAGGHIHLGLTQYSDMMSDGTRKRLIPIMDILVGNTCVLIDRDPGQAERRKTYGRAGEARLPAHGLEYRTLSNFWLRSYQLFSLVMGLSRLACNVVRTDLYFKNGVEGELLSRVDLKLIEKAINTNNVKLAWKNWEGVKDFLDHYVPAIEAGLDCDRTDDFEFFAKTVQEKGLEEFFPLDPITHWTSMPEGHGTGWEAYLAGAVTVRREQASLEGALQRIKDRK